MISTFEDTPYIHFNESLVISFMKGSTLQFKSEGEDWVDFDAKVSSKDGNPFGPWRYNSMYEWRVKPSTVEVEYEKTTVVKVKVEIPAPFKGELPHGREYFRVYKIDDEWLCCLSHRNYNPSLAEEHVENDYVYLDAKTAKEAFKILTGEQS